MISNELAQHLAGISSDLGRQVGVLLTREGSIRNVIVGDAHRLEIPEIGRLRGRGGRLRGLRLVHTHLRGEDLTPDDLADLVLLRLDLIAMLEVLPEGIAGRVQLAHILPLPDGDEDALDEPFRRVDAADVGRLQFDFGASVQALERELAQVGKGAGKRTSKDRALVVGTHLEDEHFEEVLELARSAQVEVAGRIRQKRKRPHPKTVVGKGKLQEITLESMRRQADIAIFDSDLKPAQSRAFEDATGMRAVDRTELILDIFAQRAKSRDGKLQVELAQLKYSLPRLAEKESGLSRLAGGIGGRGPGETTLEVNRRRVYDRIRKLEKQVDQLSRQRDLRRSRRRRNQLPVVSMVGYTNAGKTTLLNALTESTVEAADKLFVTLDPTTRRLRFPRELEVVLADTVGFLRDLPEDLVTAFRATLEELGDSDLLLHVVDASDPRLQAKLDAVDILLRDLELAQIPRILILNKCDRLRPDEVAGLVKLFNGVAVSALRRKGLHELLEELRARLTQLLDRPGPDLPHPAYPGFR